MGSVVDYGTPPTPPAPRYQFVDTLGSRAPASALPGALCHASDDSEGNNKADPRKTHGSTSGSCCKSSASTRTSLVLVTIPSSRYAQNECPLL